MTIKKTSSAPALYVDDDCNFKVIRDVPIPEPAGDEVVVKVSYSGVNPADVKHAPHLGIKSTTLGYDFSGRVIAAPAGSSFGVGDLVAGHTPTGIGRSVRYGAHQEYLACPEEVVFQVPDNLPAERAACLATVVATAADGLCNIFGFPVPGDKPSTGFETGPLLIWGASTSVGLCMVQLAKASGASPIFVTASPKRHELLKKLGATRCFDYAAPDVASQIREAVAEAGAGPIRYAADCAGAQGKDGSAARMARCVDGEEVKFAVVTPGPDQRFKMMLASANAPIKLAFGGGPTVEIPARREAFGRMWKSVVWAAESYGSGFELPVVDVFRGTAEEALEEVKKVADQGKFGKLVLEQPLL
ncbi:hypothetical protein CPLU01_11414 [Colletotrichum plurivorum]|uniref:Enoyl reductase (ER) domain-containing protein n=1 Tax=Colletotrichum plurivorum TaxID=2175906 RepID=A0A8H6K206_9PEZI|nr:hypothetical protein CPLU01_11414 [Colletotrichum plurivorum]